MTSPTVSDLGALVTCLEVLFMTRWQASVSELTNDTFRKVRSFFWLAVKELRLSYHSRETIIFTIYP